MKLNTAIFIITFFILNIASVDLMAEAPCTHVGHETLQGAMACANAYARSQYMDAHHNQMMNHLATQEQIPPHPYPAVGYPYYPHLYFGVGITPHWYKNSHYRWPASWYIAFPY